MNIGAWTFSLINEALQLKGEEKGKRTENQFKVGMTTFRLHVMLPAIIPEVLILQGVQVTRYIGKYWRIGLVPKKSGDKA